MGFSDYLARVAARIAGWPTHTKVLLSIATAVFLTELLLRQFAAKSSFYKKWTSGLEAVGAFWTGILLAIVYFVSVSLISLGMRAFGHDPLDRRLAAEPSFWRRHEPNPLGPEAAARHQF